MPTEIETKALEAACEKATDKLEIDWDGDEPFVRSDSIETAVEAAIRAYLAALDSPIGEQGVKPLDLANLLHHAFAAGGRAQPWTDYDPATCHAYARILSALSPERKEPVAYARVYDKAKPHYDDIVSPNSQEAEMWAYDLIPLYAGQPT